MRSSVILCYHKVGNAQTEGRWLNIEPRRLRTHVRFFQRRKWPVLMAKELAGPWPDRSVCFTFDDCYRSTMQHVPRIFEDLGVRAVFYAVPSQVGATSAWDHERAAPLADWDAILAADRAGHEIGNHSWSHARLAACPLEEQIEEVQRGHSALLERGIEPKSFCYPYGALAEREAVPYEVGLAIGKHAALETDDRKRLPRFVVAYSDALPMLLYKIWVRPKLR
jgi:peptidoglycan/xylan/chitin deacetylase (PgdA/CDA1 family)